MKFLNNLIHNKTGIILAICVVIAASLHIANIHFPCINSDEASFSYNAYSILKTGKDEYGVTMPLRFKAFGENKLPVTIYSIVPSLAIFGLNDVSARLPFIILGAIAPLLFYFLTKEIFEKKEIAIIAAFLASLSPWIQILSRHIHEATIILYLGAVALFCLSRLMKKVEMKYIIWLAVVNGVGLFTYHIAKVFMVFYLVWLLWILIRCKTRTNTSITKGIIIFVIPIIIFGISELMSPTSRVSNLLFYNNQGFSLTINELIRENPNRLVHNKLTYANRLISNQYLSYFSPEFLVRNGDANARFGFPGISPITAIEYILLFIGLYFLFHKKERSRYLLVSTLLFAPLSAALSWQEYSLTRSFFMIVPILIVESYGAYHFVAAISKDNRIRILVSALLFSSILYFVFFTWEFYFFHYPARTETIFAWQCGYKELTDVIKNDYDTTDHFYITKKLGQPYIFTLFFLKFPPDQYQKQAQLTKLDEYGFGQVEGYDKFIFNFKSPDPTENAVYIGYPDDFTGSGINEDKVKKIRISNDDIFWIYDGSRDYTNK